MRSQFTAPGPIVMMVTTLVLLQSMLVPYSSQVRIVTWLVVGFAWLPVWKIWSFFSGPRAISNANPFAKIIGFMLGAGAGAFCVWLSAPVLKATIDGLGNEHAIKTWEDALVLAGASMGVILGFSAAVMTTFLMGALWGLFAANVIWARPPADT